MGSGSRGPYGYNGGSQPYAPTYHVVPEMMDRDKADSEIYAPNKGYYKNPTAQEISSAIVHEHIEIEGKKPDGPITYVLDENGKIIVGKRSNPANPNKRSPHPMLIGGKDPQVQCAGMINFRGGKIDSINNSSGHFRPDSKSMQYVYKALRDLHENYPEVFTKKFKWR